MLPRLNIEAGCGRGWVGWWNGDEEQRTEIATPAIDESTQLAQDFYIRDYTIGAPGTPLKRLARSTPSQIGAECPALLSIVTGGQALEALRHRLLLNRAIPNFGSHKSGTDSRINDWAPIIHPIGRRNIPRIPPSICPASMPPLDFDDHTESDLHSHNTSPIITPPSTPVMDTTQSKIINLDRLCSKLRSGVGLGWGVRLDMDNDACLYLSD